jgi:spermidine/putrescine transport system ATP-binding protein
VTHDQEEAMTMADEIAVMHAGRVEQRGSAGDLYELPATEFVAGFLGVSNLIDGQLRGRHGALAEFETHDGARLLVPSERVNGATGPLRVGVRPEKITLAEEQGSQVPSDANSLRGHVSVASFLGVSIQYVIRTTGGEEITVISQNRSGVEPSALGPGHQVVLTWPPRHTFVVTKEESDA